MTLFLVDLFVLTAQLRFKSNESKVCNLLFPLKITFY